MSENLSEFITLREMALDMRVSVDTLRRHFVLGKLKDLEWVDFLGNGKRCVRRESFERFKERKVNEARKIYCQTL